MLRDVCYAEVFPNLATLWLGSNCIHSWRSVEALSALPALQELRLSGNPVMEGPRGEARSEVTIRRNPSDVLRYTKWADSSQLCSLSFLASVESLARPSAS